MHPFVYLLKSVSMMARKPNKDNQILSLQDRKQERQHSKEFLCRLQNIAKYDTNEEWLPDRHTNRHQTKWYLCAAMLHRRHKKTKVEFRNISRIVHAKNEKHTFHALENIIHPCFYKKKHTHRRIS